MSTPGLRATQATGGTTSAETLIKRAHKLLANCSIEMSPSKVTRLVRDYKRNVERNGFPFEAFLVNSVDTDRRAASQIPGYS